MPASLDLTLLPLVRIAGQDQPDLAGVYIADPPRRATRSRSGDHLILYLYVVGSNPLPPSQQEDLQAQMARRFFDTPGSVTAALRASAEALNSFLLERNLRSSNTGRQSVGLLSQVVLRGNQLYLAQSGAVHAFWVHAEGSEHLYDPQVAGRALGVSRATPIRYFQTPLAPNDTLLLAVQPAPGWSESSLVGVHGQGPESLRRRLFNRSLANLHAILVQARPGQGRIFEVHSRAGSEMPRPPQAAAEPETVEPAGAVAGVQVFAAPAIEEARTGDKSSAAAGAVIEARAETRAGVQDESAPEDETEAAPAEAQAAPQAETVPATAAEGSPVVSASTPAPGPALAPWEDAPETPEEPRRDPAIESEAEAPLPADLAAAEAASQSASPATAQAFPEGPAPAPAPPHSPTRTRRPFTAFTQALAAGLAAVLAPFYRGLAGIGRVIKGIVRRLLPDDSWSAVPTRWLAFVVFAVPPVMVAISTVFYIQRGVAIQAADLYTQAAEAALVAETEPDPLKRRAALEETLSMLEQSEKLYPRPEARELRLRISASLDSLDRIRRADFKPALIGGLVPSVKVTRMVANDTELYMLDKTNSRVWRAFITSSGYELDLSFQCATSADGAPLVGLALWPADHTPKAAVIAMDADGYIFYCQPGKAPVREMLALPPTMIWSDLVGLSMYLSHTYVLDPVQNAVWIFWNSNYDEQPEFFFGETVPPMGDVIDLAVNNDELYLLHADGHLTVCYYSALTVAPTRCNEPTPYIDLRPGRENAHLQPESPFSQIVFSPPPDPSLYFLDPKSRAIYHFSLRNLAFQEQYAPLRPERLPEGQPATAFAVNTLERTFFMAIGSEVYYARIP